MATSASRPFGRPDTENMRVEQAISRVLCPAPIGAGDDHLSGSGVAAALWDIQRYPLAVYHFTGCGGQPQPLSRRCPLTLLRVGFTRQPCLHDPGRLLPCHFTIATAQPMLPVSAVCFCCTFPKVTLAGRYPAPMPCGARTFLMGRCFPTRPSGLLKDLL